MKVMDFDTFKKIFFPHLYVVADDPGSEDEKQARVTKSELRHNKEQQPAVIFARIEKLEKVMRLKLSSCYESVRKAFLALDTDYDGYITVEDIMRFFGNEKDINYLDLKKLITDKDS